MAVVISDICTPASREEEKESISQKFSTNISGIIGQKWVTFTLLKHSSLARKKKKKACIYQFKLEPTAFMGVKLLLTYMKV